MVKPLKKEKKPKIGALIKKLDEVYSLYIRQKYADFADYVSCVTCGKTAHYKDGMQNGHYESRAHKNTRYDDQNCHVQCFRCNIRLKGNYTSYALFLRKTYGEGILEELRKRSREEKRFTSQELLDLIAHYKNLVV